MASRCAASAGAACDEVSGTARLTSPLPDSADCNAAFAPGSTGTERSANWPASAAWRDNCSAALACKAVAGLGQLSGSLLQRPGCGGLGCTGLTFVAARCGRFRSAGVLASLAQSFGRLEGVGLGKVSGLFGRCGDLGLGLHIGPAGRALREFGLGGRRLQCLVEGLARLGPSSACLRGVGVERLSGGLLSRFGRLAKRGSHRNGGRGLTRLFGCGTRSQLLGGFRDLLLAPDRFEDFCLARGCAIGGILLGEGVAYAGGEFHGLGRFRSPGGAGLLGGGLRHLALGLGKAFQSLAKGFRRADDGLVDGLANVAGLLELLAAHGSQVMCQRLHPTANVGGGIGELFRRGFGIFRSSGGGLL